MLSNPAGKIFVLAHNLHRANLLTYPKEMIPAINLWPEARILRVSQHAWVHSSSPYSHTVLAAARAGLFQDRLQEGMLRPEGVPARDWSLARISGLLMHALPGLLSQLD